MLYPLSHTIPQFIYWEKKSAFKCLYIVCLLSVYVFRERNDYMHTFLCDPCSLKSPLQRPTQNNYQ